MSSIRRVLLLLIFVASGLHAQEIRYIDLPFAEQRTELRHPRGDCKEGMLCGGSGGGSVVDGAPDRRDPRALGVYLLRVTPTDINPLKPFEAEFKVLNTGQVSLELPVSPHLSDLQPNDESLDFHYFSFSLVVRGEPEPQGPDLAAFGYVTLYGSTDRDGSMIVVRPGEWIRVRADMKLHTWPSEPVSARFSGEFWLRKHIFRPQPGGAFTETHNLYPIATSTPSIKVHLLPPLRPTKQRSSELGDVSD